MTDGVVPDAEGASPEEATADRQRMAKLQDAIAQLSAEHRTVLSLFAVDGLSHRQIAEILDIPEGTVWSRLHKARKRLREIMAMP
jgi:RNA polymerase sigma-70 factor (ECF subfamily)